MSVVVEAREYSSALNREHVFAGREPHLQDLTQHPEVLTGARKRERAATNAALLWVWSSWALDSGSSVMVCVSGGVGCVYLRANRDPDQIVGDGHAERSMTDRDRFRDHVRLGVDPRDRPVAGVRDPDRVRTHGEGNWVGSD